MEHVRGAQAVREAKSIEDLDARIATVRRLNVCSHYKFLPALPPSPGVALRGPHALRA